MAFVSKIGVSLLTSSVAEPSKDGNPAGLEEDLEVADTLKLCLLVLPALVEASTLQLDQEVLGVVFEAAFAAALTAEVEVLEVASVVVTEVGMGEVVEVLGIKEVVALVVGEVEMVVVSLTATVHLLPMLLLDLVATVEALAVGMVDLQPMAI